MKKNNIDLITGVAGFIEFSLALNLLKKKKLALGIDNLNNYYGITLKKICKKAKVKYLLLQKAHVPDVTSSIKKINRKLNYIPKVNVNEGIGNFVKWYKSYYKK